MDIRRVSTTYKNLIRYKQIGEVFVKYGFGYFVQKLFDKRLLFPFLIVKSKWSDRIPAARRLRLALEELGPTFIKLGQILSTRSDILSQEFIDELAMLQDDAPAFSYEIVKKTFEQETQQSIEEAFSYFEEIPLAAASIGQVHNAILHDGTKVVAKIQRPNIREQIVTDIEILTRLARLFDEYFKDEICFSMQDIVKEFSHSIIKELDYTIEAKNLEKFKENLQKDKEVYIPKVYWEYTSKRVIILEKIEGIKLLDHQKLLQHGLEAKKVAEMIIRSFMKQVFIYGLFHGDPHPGNIFVLPENKIAFIDMGTTGYLDKKNINFIASLFIAGAKKNIDKMIAILIQMEAVAEETDIRRLKEDLSFVLYFYYNTPLKRLKMSEAVRSLMEIVFRYKIRLPYQFTLLAKAVITLEGCVKGLNPDFNLSEVASPFVTEIIAHRFDPKSMGYEALDYIEEIFSIFKTVPYSFKNIMRKIEKDQLKIIIEQRGYKDVEDKICRSGEKIALSLIASAMFISASLFIIYSIGEWKQLLLSMGISGYCMVLFIVIRILRQK